MTNIKEFDEILQKREDCILEFKTAKTQFNQSKDLPNYCSAISNEGGGKLILGVTDDRKVVGTKAFLNNFNKLSNILLNSLKIRVDIEEVSHPNGRCLIFHIPSHQIGCPIKSNNVYWMRAGESLTAMDDATLAKKLAETEPDFSSKIVPKLKIEDLDKRAINILRQKWSIKSGRPDYKTYSDEKTLCSLGLMIKNNLNYAALILLGKKEVIDSNLSSSEIIYEWRNIENSTSYDYRINFRDAFIKIFDDIWNVINSRNIRIPFQEGFIQREIFAFTEKPIREAVLNAVIHRDYSISNRSVFIKASPSGFEINSPGGLPRGITLDNILYESAWRNRRLAEVLEKVGLVERSGQGMDDIFETTIKEGKGIPDLTKTDAFSVKLFIPAKVSDKDFILFLEKIINEKQTSLSFEEIYELENIRRLQKVNNAEYKDKLIKLGLIENIGKGRGSKYILSHRYYGDSGKTGQYTKLSGIGRDKYKELILKHLREEKKGTLDQFRDAFQELKPMDISNLLRELKNDEKIIFVGKIGNGYWILSKPLELH